MKYTSQTFKKITAVIGALVVIVGFQNCSEGDFESIDKSRLMSNTSADLVVEYPNPLNEIALHPGQAITLKLTRPSFMTNVADYEWFVGNDDYYLVAPEGKIVEGFDGKYIYISLSVKSESTVVDATLAFNLELRQISEGPGVVVSDSALRLVVDVTAAPETSFKKDAVSELCQINKNSEVVVTLNKNVDPNRGLLIMDAGSGISNIQCTVAATAVPCFQDTAWPTPPYTEEVVVTAVNRCGVSKVYTF